MSDELHRRIAHAQMRAREDAAIAGQPDAVIRHAGVLAGEQVVLDHLRAIEEADDVRAAERKWLDNTRPRL